MVRHIQAHHRTGNRAAAGGAFGTTAHVGSNRARREGPAASCSPVGPAEPPKAATARALGAVSSSPQETGHVRTC